jgi:MscS family membrane protein
MSPPPPPPGTQRRPRALALLGFGASLLLATLARAQSQAPESASSDAPAASEEAVLEARTPPPGAEASPGAEISPPKSEIIDDLVGQALRAADLPETGNSPAHFALAAAFLLLALLLRRTIVRWAVGGLRRITARTPFEFDSYVVGPLQKALEALMLLFGVFGALLVLRLPPVVESLLRYLYIAAFALIALTFILRFANASLDHLQTRARRRELNVAAFMPWIKRIVLALIFVLGVLLIAQTLGANVHAFLAGLGIGGLAVALAAQDTLANIFGSIVIAVDQPFRLGEAVQIGPNSGVVEDIGLRSTRLRTPQRNLVTIPNKTVAAEPIINLSRFIQRRVEATVPLTYDSPPGQIEALVEDIRALVLAEPEVDPGSVIVQFNELTASSLNVWLAYNTRDPDFVKHLKLRQRLNLALLRAVPARGLRFAFPTQTMHIEDRREPAPGSAGHAARMSAQHESG